MSLSGPHAQFFQIHLNGKKDYKTAEGIRVLPAHLFFKDNFQV